jgi:uncharacterized protein
MRRRLLLALAALGTLSGGLLLLLGSRLIGVAGLSGASLGLAWGALVGLFGLVLGGMILPRVVGKGPASDRLSWVGMLGLALLGNLIALTALRDLLWGASALVGGLAALAGAGPLPGHEGWPAGSSALVLGLSVGLVGLGIRNARATPAVRRVDVAIPGLPSGLEGLRIAQLTDVHVGPTIDGAWLQKVVDRVNDLDAELVAITGDLVDGSVQALVPHVAPLAGLKSRQGTFFVTGNHEYYSGAEAWVEALRGLGVRPLLNEHVVLARNGAPLVLAGVTDYNAGSILPHHQSDVGAALRGAPGGAVTVLLAHQPRSAKAAAAHGVQLQLSGHTHGGQFWPWMHFVPLQQPFTAGLRRLGELQVYTSRGTGYWGPPVRLGAPSEITLVRLVAG